MGEITLSHMSCDTLRPPNMSVAGRQGDGKRRVITSIFPLNDSYLRNGSCTPLKKARCCCFLRLRFSLIVARLQDCPGVRPQGF